MSSPLGQFCAAAKPQAILELIERLEKAEQHWENENRNNMALIAEVERLRKLEARQQEITEHYKKWFKEIVYESFDEWLKDDATHWIGEEDAALQAWQYLHENKIWLMKERIEEQEQERDRLKAENEALRAALQAFVLRADAYLEAGRGMPDVSMEVVLEKVRAALEGGGR